MAKILFGNEVFGDVPVADVRGEDEFEFGFVLMLAAGFSVGFGEVGLAIVADDFEDGFVSAGGVLVFDIEYGIDDVVAHEGTDAIFDAEAGEDGGILGGGLAVEIEFGGPPGADAVFELEGGGAIVSAATGLGEGGFGFQVEVARLLEIVGIGNKVRLLLGMGAEGKSHERQDDGKDLNPSAFGI